MQTIFSGHTQGRLAELIAPKKYLHGFGTAVALLSLFIFSQNACVSDVSAASMTLTVPAAISLDVQPTGTLAKSSANSFSAKTDGAWGYNLSIKAKSSANMVNGSASLTAISKNMAESEYQAAGNNNTWGFIPSKLNSGVNSSYIPASTGGSTIEKTSAANASAATSYSITLGAKADSSIASGTYKNTLVLTLAANSVSYNITYNCNSGTSCPAAQTGSTTASTVPLSSTKPTRDGFEFQGWCSVAVTSNNTGSPSCSGDTYQSSGNLPLTNSDNKITLHAIWKSTARSYTIHYYSNTGSPSSMPSPNPQTGSITSPYEVTISASKPTLSGYDFQGWCDQSTNNESCSGKTYQPSAKWTVASSGAQLNLYAMWKSAAPAGCSGTIPASPNAMFGGKRWTTTPVTCTWEGARQVCPSGYHLPSKTEFESLINSVGSDSQLYDAGWHDFGGWGYYWSSTEYNTSNAYFIFVHNSYVIIANDRNKTVKFYVRCVGS